ncbi:endo-1,4-beta-xylanase [Microbacterium sp. JZ31]|uniref:endo-1,4-beta-xylanase n=1 Tax=Microbacterium sp. JZ31 TaxID=1906274 RepID=UPI001931DE2A|nr:endo-1,4-beta-xylanase [Microbacterium sp. JZ31]
MRRFRLLTALSALTGTIALVVAGGAVAAPAVAATPAVETIDFDDRGLGSWSPSGGGADTLSYVPDGNGLALQVSDRANDFTGIQSPAGAFTAGNRYTVSVKVKLADGTPDTQARFVLKPDYQWGGNATVTATEWTTLTATYEPTDPAKTHQLYIGTADIPGVAAYTYLLDDLTITTEDLTPPSGGPEPGTVILDSDFESGLDGWAPRDSGSGAPTVALTGITHGGAQAAIVTGRTSQGSGIGHDVSGELQSGVTYELSAAVRFADGQPVDAVWLSLAETAAGSTTYKTLAQFEGITSTGWTQVSAKFNATDAESALLYFETNYNGTNTSDFLIDDVVVKVPAPAVVEDLPPLHGTTDFPVGVAIDARETSGAASELVRRHFNQVTPENHMKPDAWYDAERNFRIHPDAAALMDFARDNDLGLYGHVLVWHSQTPAWFFQDDAGLPLGTDEAAKQVLRERMRTHIFAVAETLAADYGAFGSDTNPLTAFDVVNEVVSDSGEFADGLRRSEWYRILGEEYIDLAFRYADEAFNHEFAAAGSDRPVTLFINDYNTEQDGKQGRYAALVDRLLARDVPIDGVGHQFHVSLAMPVSALAGALDRFEGLGLQQAVTEFDVTTGTPVTQALLVEQGYYYRDAFAVFREHDLFSATVWGLTDGRSWRDSSGDPLLFDDDLKAKPAYYGAAGGELPARLRAADVFGGAAPTDPASPEWQRLPLHELDGGGAFQARWEAGTLAVLVDVPGGDAATEVVLQVGEATYTVRGDGSGDVPVDADVTDAGVRLTAHLPLDDPAEGDTIDFDVRVTGGGAWNSPGVLGTLTLVEPLAYLEVVGTPSAPTIDGAVDDGLWEAANAVTTDVQVEGSGGATATVRTLWKDELLYVLAEVTDAQIDVTGADPWIQDSVEIYVDPGNAKNGAYRYDDTQIRISAANAVSFGTGDEAYQQARVTSRTSTVEGGYVVEAAISLLEYGGEGTFHGLDFQVNDATDGARTGIRNWADPTGRGYQSTGHWGVGQLVAAPEPTPVDTTLAVANATARYGTEATLSAKVAPAGATGTVSFRLGEKVLCTAEVEAGVATCRANAPVPGTYTVKAAYAGDAGHNASSAAFTLSVAKGALTEAPTPTISGTVKVGGKLTADAGTWAPAPVTLAYQWLSDGKRIPGATKPTYVVRGADKGHRISVTVTGSRAHYETVAKTSAATAEVAAGTFSAPTPRIWGWAKAGKVLLAWPGVWSPRPAEVSYQWLRDGKAIKGATAALYRVGSADKGHRITVRVTGSAPGYETLTRTSGSVRIAR